MKILKVQNIFYEILYTHKKKQEENKRIDKNIQDRHKF